jgi:phage terminase large subunit-like protein
MEQEQANMAEMGLTRTGRASGCSCCSFTMVGLIALPILAVVAFFLAM